MKVAFIHPDLGIGGAERLVVDAALALKNKGHEVTIFTSHHDPKHAFDETVDGTLKVVVRGNTIFPRNVVGKLSILCAIARQLHLTYSLITSKDTYDVFILDQLPAAVPYLRMHFPESRILFYCHHPDLVLTTRSSIVKKLYRLPFDHYERWCTAKSDQIAVNSNYTRKIFFETFGRRGMPDPSVIYPIVDVNVDFTTNIDKKVLSKLEPYCTEDKRFLLSINRFERKKDIDLAIASFSLLLHARTESRNHLLVIAGGYDNRVRENIEYLEELQKLAAKYRIPHATVFPEDSWKSVDLDKARILFLPSVSSQLKSFLLKNTAALLYTPTNEHFGIVPLEAMCVETPVLATNTGGPLETVVDGQTGWLREPDMEAWYHVIKYVLMDASRQDLLVMGKAGRERVIKEFSLGNLELQMNNLLTKTKETPRKYESGENLNTKMVTSLVLVAIAMIITLTISFALYFYRIYPSAKEAFLRI